MSDDLGPDPGTLERWLEEARAIAEDAGRVLLAGHRRGGVVQKKGDIDLVTEFDLASEKLITERMRAAFPSHGLVAEEGGGDADHELVWYADPLDGTTNFAHGHFVFSVAIGLARGGVPIAGVVHAPALGLTWHGGRGLGAFRNGERCQVSTVATLSGSIVGTGFPYDRARDPDNNVREAAHIIPKVQGIRRLGSAAIDLVLVADGTYDGYWEQKLSPWDLCGGAAIAEAAGATLTTYDGAPIDVRSRRIVVTNGLVHDELRREVLAARYAASL
ncbi:MAG: inositol monophosphatase [Myxococcota bacterium]|nr:inositol monophosphatase [Myxococcota bacterium]